MKISCQTCQAKYTIADEKVAGKTVKIKCKKCEDTIVVNGAGEVSSQQAAPAPAAGAAGFDEDESTKIFAGDPREALATLGNEWTVNITETDQRTMTPEQIGAELRSGLIAADTYVWRDGMSDWLPISDIPELASQIPAGAPAAAPAEDLDATVMRPSGASPFSFGAAEPAQAPQAQATQAAARRSNVNRASVDLFGAPQAPTSGGGLAPAPEGNSADKHIGERNENSVLFSLSALTAAETAAETAAKAPKAPTAPAPRGGRAPTMNRAGLDDLMSLGSGMGMGAPVLAPPPLTAPVVEAPPPPAPMPAPMAMQAPMASAAYSPAAYDEPPKKSKTGLFVGLGLAAAAVIGVAVFFAMGSGAETTAATTANTAEATASATAEATPTTTAEPAEVASAAPSTAPSAEPSATASAEPAANEPDSGKVASATSKATDTAKTGSTSAKTTDSKTADSKTADSKATAKPAETAAPAAASSDAPFDRGAASAALGSAAGSASGCKKPDGPTGTGRVSVTFAPSGRVTSANVEGPPFAGTSVGGCVASLFRGAKVPPFGGGAVTVRKSFSIH